MNFIVASIGKFHSYSVAKELFYQNLLDFYITSHPRFKLDTSFFDGSKIITFHLLQTFSLIVRKLNFSKIIQKELDWYSHQYFDKKVFHFLNKNFKNSDFNNNFFLSLSGSGLISGRLARQKKMIHICDVGSTHIKFQNNLLRKEFLNFGLKYFETDKRLIEKESAEYEECDFIIVPSNFVKNSFISEGINPDKLIKIPYGYDSQFFKFSNIRKFSNNKLRLIFAGELSLRKGLHHLLNNFNKLPPSIKKRCELHIYGRRVFETSTILAKYNLDNIFINESISQESLSYEFNKSDIMCLFSIEEGLSLTIPQAMSTGCIVVASKYTGGDEIINNGKNGIILDDLSSDHFTRTIEELIDDPSYRRELSSKALKTVVASNGFQEYVNLLKKKCVEYQE
jgi:alpha-maltose-1-phosphate synthase